MYIMSDDVYFRVNVSILFAHDHVEYFICTHHRHVSIAKMMRLDYPSINHVFDIWHVAKGVSCYF